MNQKGEIMKKAKNLLMLVAILISSCAQISSSENSGSSGSSIGSYTDSSSSSSEPIMSYTVTWKNYDGTTLEVDTVAYGTMPSYDGATPTKDSSAQYTYTFSGWSPEVVAVTDDAIYTAQFSGAINYYTVTWKNYDGTTLEVDNVAYGAMPSYDGATPSKDGIAQYTYTFSGWSPSVVAVTSDATYYAEFTETERPITKGDTYQFGTYPQSKVTDATLLSTLNAASGTLPTSANSQEWSDYGYYISGSVSSYMWYIDIRDETDGYRGVYFTSYRPYDTTVTSSTSNSRQDDNGYTTSSVYWFKYEPITWRVLDVQSNRAFLMADLVLDSQDYHYSWAERKIGGSTVYANNYKESHIRSWLNYNFYNTAFTAAEKARIQTTTVDNSVASTGFSSNIYACANNPDKVFLLSYAEATSATYGFSTTTSRQLQPSAYAQSQGVYTYTSNGISYWWLRSPHYNYASARRVNYSGYVGFDDVYSTINGIVPALWISL
jgi:hypothetical protein